MEKAMKRDNIETNDRQLACIGSKVITYHTGSHTNIIRIWIHKVFFTLNDVLRKLNIPYRIYQPSKATIRILKNLFNEQSVPIQD
jgi:hypothetical protein